MQYTEDCIVLCNTGHGRRGKDLGQCLVRLESEPLMDTGEQDDIAGRTAVGPI